MAAAAPRREQHHDGGGPRRLLMAEPDGERFTEAAWPRSIITPVMKDGVRWTRIGAYYRAPPMAVFSRLDP